jgi:hypothetical protein
LGHGKVESSHVITVEAGERGRNVNALFPHAIPSGYSRCPVLLVISG